MKNNQDVDMDTKRAEVRKWLETVPKELYPQIAQKMWPNMDPDAALSLFLKKFHNMEKDS